MATDVVRVYVWRRARQEVPRPRHLMCSGHLSVFITFGHLYFQGKYDILHFRT